MITLVPFHKADAAKAAKMLNLSAKLGFVTNHQCVCMYPNDTPSALVNEVEKAARSAFKDVEMFMIPHEIPNSWPAGPNKMFATGCTIMFRKWPFETIYDGKYQSPNGMFLWMEPDMVPLQPGYLDRLQQEYLMGGKPCLGVIAPTIKQRVLKREDPTERDLTTNTVPLGSPTVLGEKFIDGEHMVGAGIYDRGLSQIIGWIDEAAGLADPFDVTLQYEICQKDGNAYTRITPSQLIVHNWESSNYRITKLGDISEIECDAHVDNPGQGKFILSKYANIGPCLAHGCKDDSLYAIVEQIHGLGNSTIGKQAMQLGSNQAQILVNEKPQGMQIPNGPSPLRITTSVTLEETQVIVGGKPYMVPTSKLTGQSLAQMEAVAAAGGDPMIVFAPVVIPVTEVAMSQSSSLSEPEHDDDDLSPEELRIYAKLQAKIDRRINHKKKAKAVKAKKPVTKVRRPTIDEDAVWEYYNKLVSEGDKMAYQKTLKEHRLSPKQLKTIRDKNTVTV